MTLEFEDVQTSHHHFLLLFSSDMPLELWAHYTSIKNRMLSIYKVVLAALLHYRAYCMEYHLTYFVLLLFWHRLWILSICIRPPIIEFETISFVWDVNTISARWEIRADSGGKPCAHNGGNESRQLWKNKAFQRGQIKMFKNLFRSAKVDQSEETLWTCWPLYTVYKCIEFRRSEGVLPLHRIKSPNGGLAWWSSHLMILESLSFSS